jgi:hypothetical protein
MSGAFRSREVALTPGGTCTWARTSFGGPGEETTSDNLSQ